MTGVARRRDDREALRAGPPEELGGDRILGVAEAAPDPVVGEAEVDDVDPELLPWLASWLAMPLLGWPDQRPQRYQTLIQMHDAM